MHFHHIAVDVRQDRRRTADGHEPEGQKMQKQRSEIDAVHHSCSFQAARTAQGASAPMTHSSGQRMMPTPTKASVPNSHGRQRRGNTVASLMTVASNSPAATMD